MAYSLEGLKHGLERCDVNIASLKRAIEKEQGTKAQYRIMIDQLEQADKAKKVAESGVHLELVHGSKD